MNFLERSFGKLSLSSAQRRQARQMDPIVRQSLSHVVSEETAAGADELREIQSEMSEFKQKLQESQEKEQFLGIRTRQYRKALDEQMVLLQAEKDRLIDARKKLENGVPEEEVSQSIDEEALEPETKTMSMDALRLAEAALARRMEKWEADENALSSIVETHKLILASCENMRRSIVMLEEKEKQIIKLRGNCEDFLETATVLENEEESPGLTHESSQSSPVPEADEKDIA